MCRGHSAAMRIATTDMPPIYRSLPLPRSLDDGASRASVALSHDGAVRSVAFLRTVQARRQQARLSARAQGKATCARDLLWA